MLRSLIAVCGLLAALPIGASAAKIISCSAGCGDPTIDVLTSLGGSLGITLPSNGADTLFEYENDTGAVIDELSFVMTIDQNILGSGVNTEILNGTIESGPTGAANVINTNFSCAQTDSLGTSGFFQNCSVTYQSDGTLIYDFFGVGAPSPPNSNIHFGDWQNEQAGIPSCPTGFPVAWCDTPTAGGLFNDYDRGLFELDFTGFQTGGTGASQYYPGGTVPTIDGTYAIETPEPASVLLFFTLLLLIFRRFRTARGLGKNGAIL